MTTGFEPGGAELPEAGTEVDASPEPSMQTALARGGLWALGGQAAILVATLVATPFVIRELGPAEYGLWALLLSSLLYFTLGDLGMNVASTKFASEQYARDDPRGEVTVICTALAITVAITGFVAVAVMVAAPLIVDEVLRLPDSLRSEGLLGLRVMCIAAVAYGVAGTISTPQQVRLRWGSFTLATSGSRVLQIAAAPLVLLATAGGVVPLAVLAAAAAALAAGLNAAVALRLQPGLRRPRLSRNVADSLIRYGGALTIAGLAAIPLATGERFLLAYFHSTTEVAYYAAAATIGALLNTIPHSTSQVLLPALVRLRASGRREDLRRLYRQALQGIFLVTVPAAMALAFVAQPFLTFWAGPSFGANSAVPLYIIVACLAVNTIAYVPTTQLLAAGRASTLAKVHVAELLPYLAVAALLTNAFGARGAAAAWGGLLVVTALIFFVVVERADRLGWDPTPERTWLSVVALACLGAAFVLMSTTTASLASRGAWSVAILVAYAVMVWRYVLTPQERNGLSALIGTLTRRSGEA